MELHFGLFEGGKILGRQGLKIIEVWDAGLNECLNKSYNNKIYNRLWKITS